MRASKLIYGTMTGTDMALHLDDQCTYAQISTWYHVSALRDPDTHPVAGTSIRVVSGFWKDLPCARSASSRRYCARAAGAGTTDPLLQWSPLVIGGPGSAGSSMPACEVIGINNTTNEKGERCTLTTPARVDTAGTVTVEKGRSYGQQL